MSGLSGNSLTLRSQRLVVRQSHNEAHRSCEVVVAFGMPYEILLGAICHSIENAKAIGGFFRDLSAVDEFAVRTYLAHFITRLRAEVDFDSSELEVKPEFRNTPMDFPRPSPTLRFLLPAFFAELAAGSALRDLTELLPIRLVNPDPVRRPVE